MRWPFRREHRQAASIDYASEIHERAHALASGQRVESDALAAVATAAGLWERCLMMATVTPSGPALAPMNAHMLGLIGRSLAQHGEFLALIEVVDGTVILAPASGWDVRGGSTDPRRWSYWLTLPAPHGSRTVTRPAVEVLHARIGASVAQPWRGRSPLRAARTTANLAGRVEAALSSEAALPSGRIIGLTSDNDANFKARSALVRKGGLSVEGRMPASYDQQHRSDPVTKYGPDPSDAFADSLRGQLGRDILSAYGIPPNLFSETGDGAGAREAWRRLWLATIQPLAEVLVAELRLKLDENATVSLDALRAADDDQRSRAVSRRVQAAGLAVEKLSMSPAQALDLVGL